ncbi:5-formyltetrahydrofolate cyclo-ligase [Thiomicrospira sp. ALE5]|uniref:5-formyltetrahydrofolate cyclo-ligase n=1 Tax=Thiomicrospira sp. ALE5 TaxID=748650 RepID=UPI0008EB86E5|nr:5-formyltetrahydrofolate cyclo-ligase [Thiomicrospira sp. ALE5]SFR52258.1 5-formyltetrahydrofolate cyclo-ligase [Thiomicrospira sp. ALE5]
MRFSLSQLRQMMRLARQNLSLDVQRQHAADASLHFQNYWPWLNRRSHAVTQKVLLGFIAADGELATQQVLEWVLAEPDWQLALPVLGSRPGEMHCGLWDGQVPLQPNRFGILEPDRHQPICALEQIQCVLMPLVAFDNRGNRLGMGGGYYDRLLAGVADLPSSQRPWLVGWAHSLQKVDYLIPQPWDISLDACITEQACHVFTD